MSGWTKCLLHRVRASAAGLVVLNRRTPGAANAADLFRWQKTPNSHPDVGWAEVGTPLGACVHVPVNSLAWELCSEWHQLQCGRGALTLTDPVHWFGEETLASAPTGLVAELFAAGGRMGDFTRLVSDSTEARAHILRVPEHVFGAEPEEWILLGECLDIVRPLEAREAARAAAVEALRDRESGP